MSLNEDIKLLCQNAKEAAARLALEDTEAKNRALIKIADMLTARAEEIVEANRLDLENAEENEVPLPMIDRLTLNEARIEGIAASLRNIAELEDPVGKSECWDRPSGLHISRVRVPIGVIGIIYEARPNVTVDSAALCIKTGNSAVLRGGKEAINTNKALVAVIKEALDECGLDPHCVELIESTERESANILMTMRGYIDVLIPRGGKGLINSVVENATVPVIEAVSEKGFSFNISCYTQEELGSKMHNFELEEADCTVVCLDYAMSGIGSNSCGPRQKEHHQFNEPKFKYHIRINML